MKKLISTFSLACLFSIGSLIGQTYNLSGTADGTQEVPPNGSTGTAAISGTYDQATKMITVNIPFSGLVTPTTAAHIHSAPVGMNGPVIVPLTIPGGVTAGVITGTYPVAPADEAALLAGDTYLNIHTQMQPGGEIRGQITAAVQVVPTLGEWAVISLALIMAIFGVVFICQPKLQTSRA